MATIHKWYHATPQFEDIYVCDVRYKHSVKPWLLNLTKCYGSQVCSYYSRTRPRQQFVMTVSPTGQHHARELPCPPKLHACQPNSQFQLQILHEVYKKSNSDTTEPCTQSSSQAVPLLHVIFSTHPSDIAHPCCVYVDHCNISNITYMSCHLLHTCRNDSLLLGI